MRCCDWGVRRQLELNSHEVMQVGEDNPISTHGCTEAVSWLVSLRKETMGL